jgi:hypothetical protein
VNDSFVFFSNGAVKDRYAAVCMDLIFTTRQKAWRSHSYIQHPIAIATDPHSVCRRQVPEPGKEKTFLSGIIVPDIFRYTNQEEPR